jgi:hypothetical protein
MYIASKNIHINLYINLSKHMISVYEIELNVIPNQVIKTLYIRYAAGNDGMQTTALTNAIALETHKRSVSAYHWLDKLEEAGFLSRTKK